MSYTALYRKFRPDNFEDVKGQEHIVTTLKNQINVNRIGHAYLFCGTRGTGKTTVAKILAKAVNCEKPENGSPCNNCPACRAINAGASMNVIEIDAASNNGVDNIREIREEVMYPPTEGNYKVYIIDEVHMLSIGAFNALLKTLEEPPSYVIFILATTEAHKIPITILSRCQRYDFKRISIEVISDRLRELAEKENVDIEEKAIRYIAKAADGAMRDALSILDRCIAFYFGEKLTYDNVLEVLGAVDLSVFSGMFQAILEEDAITAIEKLEDVVMSGRDLSQFVVDFTWYLRNIMLVKTSDDEANDIIDVTSENLEMLKEEAKMTDINSLIRYIRVLSELTNTLKNATSKRVLVEVALVKMTRPMMENDMSSVLSRISSIEKKMESKDFVRTVYKEKASDETTIEEPVKKKLDIAVPEDIEYIVKNWNEVERALGGKVKTVLKSARFSNQGDDRLVIQYAPENETSYKMVANEDGIKEITDAIAKATGKEVKVEIKLLRNDEKLEDNFVEVLKNKINFEVIEEDF